jgi:hypothetical protein
MTKFQGKFGPCPKCNANWDDGCIIETLVAQDWWKKETRDGKLKYPTEEDFVEYIKQHYAPPRRFSRVIGVSDPRVYDGVSWWKCPDCNTYWDRFTEEEVEENKDD